MTILPGQSLAVEDKPQHEFKVNEVVMCINDRQDINNPNCKTQREGLVKGKLYTVQAAAGRTIAVSGVPGHHDKRRFEPVYMGGL